MQAEPRKAPPAGPTGEGCRKRYKVWEARLPASGYATPITYEVKGKKYVAIVATGGSQVGAPLLSDGMHVFALGN